MVSKKKLTYNKYLKAYRADPAHFISISNPESKPLTRKQFNEIIEENQHCLLRSNIIKLLLESNSGIKPPILEECNTEFWKDVVKVYEQSSTTSLLD